MNIKGKSIIVTGGARGIGAAMAARFALEGANVVLADLDIDAVTAAAAKLNSAATNVAGGADVGTENCVGVVCDVTNEDDVKALVKITEAHFGQVDMFCSNAGVYLDEPTHSASASNDTWSQCWNVHVMAHVYAARAVLPGMIERGDGYLLQMSSAAGLLSQIGNAAYSATKHAAIGFAESLAISHSGDGIKVSVICPQYVATPMLGYTEGENNSNAPGVITPEVLAESVVQGIAKECFLILPHPDVAQYIQFKSANYDKWLSQMHKLRCEIVDKIGTTNVVPMHTLI